MICTCLSLSSIALCAPQPSVIREIKYEGTWVAGGFNGLDVKSSVTWIVSIHKYGKTNRYLIVAIAPSRESDVYSFVGSGVEQEDGSIQVTTHTGFTWFIGRGWSAEHGKQISIWEKGSDWSQTLFPVDLFPPLVVR